MKTALITGANKGLGLEFVRQLKDLGFYIIACCRQPSAATELNQLADEIIKLDVTQDQDIAALKQKLNNKPIDLLINNAGISGDSAVTVGNIDRANFLEVMNVNCLSVLKVSEALLPNLKASQDKNILVISSQMGSIADNNSGGSYAYRSSKAALNCAMRSFAHDIQSEGVFVMLMHPGWVQTDMGGSAALIDAKTSVKGMLEQVHKHFSNSHATELRRYDDNIIPW